MKSFVKNDHKYSCRVIENKNPDAKTFYVSVNDRGGDYPTGEEVILQGSLIQALYDAGYERAITRVNPQTGYVEVVGKKWEPRFSVEIIADLTERQVVNLPSLPQNDAMILLTPEQKDTAEEQINDVVEETRRGRKVRVA